MLLEQARAIVAKDPTDAARLLSEYRLREADGDAARWIELEAKARGVAASETRISGTVGGLRWLAGDRYVALWSDEEYVLWDVSAGKEAIRDYVENGVFASPDRTRVVQLDTKLVPIKVNGDNDLTQDGTSILKIAVAPDFKFERQITVSGNLAPTVLSPTGTQLLSLLIRQSDGHVGPVLIDLETGKTRKVDSLNSTAVTEDGALVDLYANPRLTSKDGAVHLSIVDDQRRTKRFVQDARALHYLAERVDSRVCVMDGLRRTLRQLLPPSRWARLMAISDDGSSAALVEGRVLRVQHVGNSEPEYTATLPTDATSVAIQADGSSAAVGLDNGQVFVWRRTNAKSHTFVAHEGPIAALDYSSDGTRLASLTGDGNLRVWNVASRPVRFVDRVAGKIVRLETAGDQAMVVTEGGLVMFDRSGRRIFEHGSTETIVDGKLANGDVFMLEASGRLLKVEPDGGSQSVADHIRELQASRDGHAVAGVGFDSWVHLWREGVATRYETDPPASRVLGLSPTGDRLLIQRAAGKVELWNLTIPPKKNKPTVVLTDLMPGETTAGDVAKDDRAFVVALTDGRSMQKPTGDLTDFRWHDMEVGSHAPGRVHVRLAHDGTWTFSGGADGTVWARESKRHERHRFHPCRAAIVDLEPSPAVASVVAVACADGTIRLLDASSASGAVEITDPDITHIGFSADGSILWSIGQEGALQQWNTSAMDWQSLPFRLRDSTAASSAVRAKQRPIARLKALLEWPRIAAVLLTNATAIRARTGTWPNQDLAPTGACGWHDDIGREIFGPPAAGDWVRTTLYHLEAHHFRYAVRGSGTTFTVEALGDFDCDAVSSRVLIRGHLDKKGAPIIDDVEMSRMGW